MTWRSIRPPSLLAQPAYLASMVSRYGKQELERALAERGLRLIHHGVLSALADFGPIAQQQIADALDVDKSHLVRHIDHLERHGLATRIADTTDRRRNQIAITAAGRELLDELDEAQRRSQARFIDVLSAEERQTLLALLRRVLDANDRARLHAPADEPTSEDQRATSTARGPRRDADEHDRRASMLLSRRSHDEQPALEARAPAEDR